MANQLRVPNTDSYITWVQTTDNKTGEKSLSFTVRDKEGNPIAKAKLTAEQIHAYVCLHNTMK